MMTVHYRSRAVVDAACRGSNFGVGKDRGTLRPCRRRRQVVVGQVGRGHEEGHKTARRIRAGRRRGGNLALMRLMAVALAAAILFVAVPLADASAAEGRGGVKAGVGRGGSSGQRGKRSSMSGRSGNFGGKLRQQMKARGKALEEPCIPRRPWRDFIEGAESKKCDQGGKNPLFSAPFDCKTRRIDQDLALSIANGVFECDKWCVYSIDPAEDGVEEENSWIWDVTGQCWTSNRNCFEFADEVATKADQVARLCPPDPDDDGSLGGGRFDGGSGERDENGEAKSGKWVSATRAEGPGLATGPGGCVPLAKNWQLNVHFLKKKCPKYHSQAKPILHAPIVCETGKMDSELTQAIVNGAFSACKNWCVYSLKSPTQIAWFWKPEHMCWTANNTCTGIPSETKFAKDLSEKLCRRPCSEPRSLDELTVDTVKQKCPLYDGKGGGGIAANFHDPVICSPEPNDPDVPEDMPGIDELRNSLVNFAYAECKNWCVYSLERPRDNFWLWQPARKCWLPQGNLCNNVPKEIQFVEDLRNSLCLPETKRHMEYRKIQLATPTPQDTGLTADPGSRAAAYEMYTLFGVLLAFLVVLLAVVQYFVPPADGVMGPATGVDRIGLVELHQMPGEHGNDGGGDDDNDETKKEK